MSSSSTCFLGCLVLFLQSSPHTEYTSWWSDKSQNRPVCVALAVKVPIPAIFFHSLSLTDPFFCCLVADRRPIDPPPIVQLRVIDPVVQQSGSTTTPPSRRRQNSSSGSAPSSPTPSAASTARHHPEDPIDSVSYAQSFLQNPYYFMFASLARPDDDAELHWLKVIFFYRHQINFRVAADKYLSRTVERDVPRVQWFPHCIILKTPSITMKVQPLYSIGSLVCPDH